MEDRSACKFSLSGPIFRSAVGCVSQELTSSVRSSSPASSPISQVFNATLLTYYDIFQDAEVRVLRIGDRNLLLETKTLTNSIIVSQPLQNVETVGSFRQQTHFLTSSTTISPSQHASVLHRLKPNVVKEPVRAVQYIPPSATARYDARLAKPKVRIQTPGRPVATKLYTPNKPAPQYVDFAVTGKKWPARMREAPCHEAHMEWSPSHLNRIFASAKRITDDLL
jgi:hypothetical protein